MCPGIEYSIIFEASYSAVARALIISRFFHSPDTFLIDSPGNKAVLSRKTNKNIFILTPL